MSTSNPQQKLLKSIVAKLRLDTGTDSLVARTNHSSSNIRIARDRPILKSETPYLGVFVSQSVPVMGDGPDILEQARVHFRAYAAKELTSMQIADRLSYLLQGWSQHSASPNTGYYDFSSVSDGISNRHTRYAGRDGQLFNDKTDVWNTLIEADLIWTNKACT
jgi:hypothetical protein